MADARISDEHLDHMLKLAQSTDDLNVLKELCEWLINELMKQDVTDQIQAEPHERNDQRTNQRNGYRDRMLKTRVGALELRIPKLREGTYYPDWLLKRQQPAEQALIGTVMEAYTNGVSTRKMTNLVEEMGLDGMDKSEVSRINKQLDGKVREFQTRQFRKEFPYVYLDATNTKVRENGVIVNASLVMAVGVSETGHREILGFELGGTEDEAFWMEFLKGLKKRGLRGTRLVISDAHVGLRSAINTVFSGTAWQRCIAHYKNNLAVQTPSQLEEETKAWVDSIMNAPSESEARHQIERAKEWFNGHDASKASNKLEDDKEDLLTHMSFPKDHWKRLRTINSVERLNREVKRRFNVVGIFPDRDSIIRLGGAYLLQQHDSWVSSKRYFSEESMEELMKDSEHQQSKVVKLK